MEMINFYRNILSNFSLENLFSFKTILYLIPIGYITNTILSLYDDVVYNNVRYQAIDIVTYITQDRDKDKPNPLKFLWITFKNFTVVLENSLILMVLETLFVTNIVYIIMHIFNLNKAINISFDIFIDFIVVLLLSSVEWSLIFTLIITAKSLMILKNYTDYKIFKTIIKSNRFIGNHIILSKYRVQIIVGSIIFASLNFTGSTILVRNLFNN